MIKLLPEKICFQLKVYKFNQNFTEELKNVFVPQV